MPKREHDLTEQEDYFSILDDGYDLTQMVGSKKTLERADMPDGRITTKREARAQYRHVSRREQAADLLETLKLPEPGETHHVISNAKYDFFNVIIAAARQLAPVEEFYGSTWTMSKYNVDDLIKAMEDGTLQKVSILTGTYFKKRESSVYAQLITAMAKRNQRYTAFINHTKIALLKAGDTHIVFEGSANFTANPRLENYIVCNDPELYQFHREWMEEMLK